MSIDPNTCFGCGISKPSDARIVPQEQLFTVPADLQLDLASWFTVVDGNSEVRFYCPSHIERPEV